MAKRSLDAQLGALNELRDRLHAPETAGQLARALESKHAPLVAAAAHIACEGELAGLGAAMQTAFERFLVDGTKTDKGCIAKQALADALYKLDANCPQTFLLGIRCVQLEPIWGGRTDTAAPLRGICALGLVRCNYLQAPFELARLLADPEVQARMAAAHALAYTQNQDVAGPLLYHKVLAGDAETSVSAACMQGLLGLLGERAVPWVGEIAGGASDELAEAALLALGEARSAGALSVLRALFEQPIPSERRKVAALAIAMLRDDESWDYLIETIAEGPEGRARDAIDALATYRHDASLRERVETAAEESGLKMHVREAFDARRPTSYGKA